MAQKGNIRAEGLVPQQSTTEYSISTCRTPVNMAKVTRFGSHFISPAHQGGIQNAVDFYTPNGTAVRAPATGVICGLVEKFDAHGLTKKYWLMGNELKIKCKNGEYILLEHLQCGFAKKLNIKIGQKVSACEVVGMSGDTGFAEFPHVHMEVQKFIGDVRSKRSVADYKNYITKKIRFDSRDIPFDLYLKEGEATTRKFYK
jgi:murein DD-endopeptidase MepM/ murein hydrolase activator NlpD